MWAYVNMQKFSIFAYGYWYLPQQSNTVEALLVIALDLFPVVYSNQCMSDPLNLVFSGFLDRDS